jgi:hypothetical protein
MFYSFSFGPSLVIVTFDLSGLMSLSTDIVFAMKWASSSSGNPTSIVIDGQLLVVIFLFLF